MFQRDDTCLAPAQPGPARTVRQGLPLQGGAAAGALAIGRISEDGRVTAPEPEAEGGGEAPPSGAERWARQYQGWVIALALVVMVGAVVLLWPGRPGAPANELSVVPPSPVRLAAMAQWYERHGASGAFDGSSAPFGCAVYPMATGQLGSGRSVAYTQVFCEQCPPSHLSGLTPVAFRLHGAVVESAGVAVGAGGPGFLEKVKRYFPRQLWSAATDQQIPALDMDLLEADAFQVAGCSK